MNIKKIIQAISLIVIAALAVVAAASSYPVRQHNKGLRQEKGIHMDTAGTFGCRYSPEDFIYQPNH